MVDIPILVRIAAGGLRTVLPLSAVQTATTRAGMKSSGGFAMAEK
jgi:hypothetical protein